MTETQKTKLLCLYMALTVPDCAKEHYYYDGLTELFFYAKEINNSGVALYSFLGYPLSEKDYSYIGVRMEFLEDSHNDILEIPRLNVSEKKVIQLEFLNHFEGIYNIKSIIKAVECQRDDYNMVLDSILIENTEFASMASSWRDFKLTAVLTYMKNFISSLGMEFSL